MHRPGAKVPSGFVLPPTRKCQLTKLCTLPPFYRTCKTVSLLFLAFSSQDSLTLEEPVKVCVLSVMTGIKPTLGCNGKAEG